MGKIKVIATVILSLIVLYYPIEYFFFWLPKHKKSMKKFKEDLEENKWRRENASKEVPQNLTNKN